MKLKIQLEECGSRPYKVTVNESMVVRFASV